LETSYLYVHIIAHIILCLLNHYLGKVRGIVKCDDSKVAIEWRLGPNFDATDAFISKNNADEAEEIIGLYVQDKDKTNYDWFQYITPMKESAIKFIQSAREAPEGTTFVDWKRLMDCDDYFENINDEEKWDNTLARLNDPRMAHHYPNDKYPKLALLTMYSICVNVFPIMVTEANAQMFKLSDAMCRQVTGTRGWSTGYGNLIAFENITKNILEDYPPNKANSLYKVWKEGYCHTQALMLVLSDEFEQAMWDYDMCDDPERVENLLGSFLKVFTTYMNPDNAPTDAAREQLEKDLDFNDQHLRAGRFMSDAKEYHDELYQSFVKCIKDNEE